ncbi:MAG: hypothetical protein WC517_02445 [Patescibacteria group bacterium]
MRSPSLKNSKVSSVKRKKSAAAGESLASPISKNEPAYINVNENQAELDSKSRLLWIIVAIFGIALAIFWLFTLRANIKKEANDIGFSQLAGQISESLARFDTEIKNRALPEPIKTEDLAAIKDNLEAQIKNNPDSSAWPTHEFAPLNFSIQYPSDWSATLDDRQAVLTDFRPSTSTVSNQANFGRITINKLDNSAKLDLAAWQKKNKIKTDGYVLDQPLFAADSNAPETLAYQAADATGLDLLIYLNNQAGRTVYEIKIEANGDFDYYRPLAEAIVRTIKILN